MSAILDDTRMYRYRLSRSWRTPAHPPVLWVMLNPSTADESVDDPTIRKCIGFQSRWCGGGRPGPLEVVNLFALRAADPRELSAHPGPVGPANDDHLRDATVLCRRAGGTVVAAWGSHPFARNRARWVSRLIGSYGGHLMCLGTTKDGSPRHPLYVPYSQPLVPWEGYR